MAELDLAEVELDLKEVELVGGKVEVVGQTAGLLVGRSAEKAVWWIELKIDEQEIQLACAIDGILADCWKSVESVNQAASVRLY